MPLSVPRFATIASLLVFRAVVTHAQATGSIEGFVRDSAGHPLEQAQLWVLNHVTRARIITDTTGSYRIPGVDVGTARLFARRVGFVVETLSVRVAAGRTSRVDLVMLAMPATLATEYVSADPTLGKMGPFNRRMSRGVGSFVTRAEIEKRQPASISELLRTLPGVSISQRMAGEPQPVHMQRSVNSSLQSTCVVQIYVDGQPYPNGNLDDFAPLTLEGVEVYRSASEIPADFRTRDATCGLVALWTRDPEAARRKP